jgi:hypothetical protein
MRGFPTVTDRIEWLIGLLLSYCRFSRAKNAPPALTELQLSLVYLLLEVCYFAGALDFVSETEGLGFDAYFLTITKDPMSLLLKLVQQGKGLLHPPPSKQSSLE